MKNLERLKTSPLWRIFLGKKLFFQFVVPEHFRRSKLKKTRRKSPDSRRTQVIRNMRNEIKALAAAAQ